MAVSPLKITLTNWNSSSLTPQFYARANPVGKVALTLSRFLRYTVTPPADARMTAQAIPTAVSVGTCSGRILRMWMKDRDAELRRRSYRILYRLTFPPPIPIVSLPPLAKNKWLGWHGMD
jgi:hypothetical protein